MVWLLLSCWAECRCSRAPTPAPFPSRKCLFPSLPQKTSRKPISSHISSFFGKAEIREQHKLFINLHFILSAEIYGFIPRQEKSSFAYSNFLSLIISSLITLARAGIFCFAVRLLVFQTQKGHGSANAAPGTISSPRSGAHWFVLHPKINGATKRGTNISSSP